MSPGGANGGRRNGVASLKTCPVCGVTMFADKVDEGGATVERLRCPRCDFVIVSTSRGGTGEPEPKTRD
jgi:ribosomal protein S27AE